MAFDIQPLFANPVLTTIPDGMVTPYYNAINHCKALDYYINVGRNLTSSDTKILDHPVFVEINDLIQHAINQYAHDIMKWDNVELYVTQSWININPKGTEHHSHYHPNSVISGVFYLQTVTDDSIVFRNDNCSLPFEFDRTEYNIWNSNIWRIPVSTNEIVIFPSSLWHSVDTHDDDVDRISIAFNVFFRGHAGGEIRLTHLPL